MLHPLACGHDNLALVWLDDDHRYACQDCLLGRAPVAVVRRPTVEALLLPERAKSHPAPHNAQISRLDAPSPIPAPATRPRRVTITPKRHHILHDAARMERQPPPPPQPRRRWVHPNTLALGYEWLDGEGWHRCHGSAEVLYANALALHTDVERELLTHWGLPFGPCWSLGQPFALVQRSPLYVLSALAAGTAVLVERPPLGRTR